MISNAVRDFLIAHIDGPVPVTPGLDLRARSCAIASGFVVRDQAGPRTRHRLREVKPTILTDRGRGVLAAALGNWADAIVRVDQMKESLGLDEALRVAEAEPEDFAEVRVYEP